MAKVTLRDIDVANKRVLVRVDFNVPLEERSGKMVVTDDTRIRETLPTLEYLRKAGAKIILAAHLGRPKGKPDPAASLRPTAEHLQKLLGEPVTFAEDCIGAKTEAAAQKLKPGEVLLLENVRFYPGEEKNDPDFATELAKLADVYINDAFGAAHRAHASTEGVARLIPSRAIGLLMERELKFLGEELAKPGRPFVVILGGAKVSDKIKVIEALLEKADVLLIGGAMAYTFDLARGRGVGKSLVEPDCVEIARATLAKAKKREVEFFLPVDHMIAQEVDFRARTISELRATQPGESIPDGWQGVDIGPETLRQYQAGIAKARTVLWNGPMGIFEIPACARGTFGVAQAVAVNKNVISIIGGGDSVKAVHQAKLADQMTFISTGGGASLEFLEGKTLPGLAAIPERA